ncbi:predicted protein [Nematostella vectensis]|uniref:VWFA domain-containing protein n=1 Tax=Nematostella vectensis TaxID=45351 RepID=A7SIL3_NEMVE|nr:predicted protein [Nematostella vectensis]|eukprot:XP_001628533.1 predicted protein [Nematostella vectensis]
MVILALFFNTCVDAPRNLVKREAQNSSDSGICQKPVDLVLALDSSESVGAENWMKMINATIKFVNQFDVRYTRFGLIQFHSSPEVPIVLSSFPDNKTLSETIAKVYYKAGSTRTDLAAMKVVEVFKAASHRKASKVAVFILGGLSTDVYVSQGQ